MAGGLGVMAVIGAGAGIAGNVMQARQEEAAEQAQENSLRLQENQVKAKAAQDAISRDKQIQQVESSQRARAVASGMSLTSGTYNALSDASYNQFAQDTHVANINLQSDEDEINQRIDAAQSQLHSQLLGNLFSGISDLSGLASFHSGHSGSSQQPNMQSFETGSEQPSDIIQTYGTPKSDYEYFLRNSVEWQ